MQQLFIENFRSPETVQVQGGVFIGNVTIDNDASFASSPASAVKYPIAYTADAGKSGEVATFRFTVTPTDSVSAGQLNTLLIAETATLKVHLYLSPSNGAGNPQGKVVFDYSDGVNTLTGETDAFATMFSGDELILNITIDRTANQRIVIFDDDETITGGTIDISSLSTVSNLFDDATHFSIGGKQLSPEAGSVFEGDIQRIELWNDAYTVTEYQTLATSAGFYPITTPRTTTRWALTETYGDKDIPVAQLKSPVVTAPQLIQCFSQLETPTPNGESRVDPDVEFVSSGYHLETTIEPRLFTDSFLITDRVYGDVAYYYEYELRYDVWADASGEAPSLSIRNDKGQLLSSIHYVIEYHDTPRAEEYDDGSGLVTARYTKYDIDSPDTTWVTKWGETIRPSDEQVYRIRLLLPEWMAASNHTWYVHYTRQVSRDVSGTPVTYTENASEIINPRQLYTYGKHFKHNGTDYTHIVFPMVYEADSTRGVSGERSYKIQDRFPIIDIPRYTKYQAWHPRVLRGVANINGTYFRVNNTYDDSFTEGEYHGRISLEQAFPLSAQALQVQHAPLVVTREEEGDTTGYPTYEILAMQDDRPEGPSCTSGEGSLTIYVNGQQIANSLIEDVDEWNGIIYFKRPILQNGDTIQVSYKYRQDYVYLYSLDLNPFTGHRHQGMPENTTVFDNSVTIYLNPLNSDPDERDSLLWKWDGESTYYDVMETVSPSTGTLDSGAIPLGMLSVKEILPEDLRIHDIRRGGGGLQEGLTHEQMRSITDMGWFDGQPIPGSVVALRIDESHLTQLTTYYQNTLRMTETDARDRSILYLAAAAARYVQAGAVLVVLNTDLNFLGMFTPSEVINAAGII